jgi:hypothetical protein
MIGELAKLFNANQLEAALLNPQQAKPIPRSTSDSISKTTAKAKTIKL